MKIHRLIPIMLLLIITLLGCKKDGNVGEELSKDEMNFTAGSSPNTKTVYDKKNPWQINWIEGDQITIFCDQAGNKKQAAYDVTPLTRTPYKGTITLALSESPDNSKERRTGLRWREGKHNVYSVYPSLEQSGGNITKQGEGKFTFNFPQTQYCSKEGVTLINGNYMLRPNMYLAYMVAKNEGLDPLSFVELLFKPIATTLEITVKGVAQMDSVGISSLELKVKNLAGQYVKKSGTNYQVQFDAKQQFTSPTTSVSDALTPYASGSVTTADFSIQVKGGNPIYIKANESVTFTVFLPPIEKLDDVEIKCMGTEGLELGKKQILTNLEYAKSASKRRIKLPPVIGMQYFFEVTGPDDFEYSGGTKPYSVLSYKKFPSGEIQPVKWGVQYSTDNGATWTPTKPDWLTDFTESGLGSKTAQSYDATVIAQIGSIVNIHTDKLRSKPLKGTQSSPYNLTNSSGGSAVENTANCYVVDAPGFYSFPLVYGNAIKNSAPNPSAYTTSATTNPKEGKLMQTFLNHAGDEITDPYIINNGCVPASAELVWQDAPTLVSNIAYNNTGANGGTISFEVNKSTIRQGNAVIAIKDAGGTVLWSWHIWVTDEDVNNSIAVVNHDAITYDFMPVNLGWCDGETTTYLDADCKVKFIAEEGEKIQEITIRRNPGVVDNEVNSPFYQWGRKDPFQPSDGKGNNKTWYDSGGTPSTSNPPRAGDFGKGVTCIKNYIQNPNTYLGRSGGDGTYSNLWSANNYNVTANTNDIVVKTIYDPSPIGYSMPASAAFTGFTTTGEDGAVPHEVNGFYDNNKKIWNFYTNPTKTKTITFYPMGVRNSGGVSSPTYFYYYTSAPRNYPNGHMFSGTSSYVKVSNLSFANRIVAHPVRPCKEK